jgi:hypothetical protein
MAAEFQFQILQDETVYAVVRDSETGEVCDPADGSFGAWSAFDDHKIAATVDGGLLASADMPADVVAGYYYGVCYNSDGTQVRSVTETKYWNGSAWVEGGEDLGPGDYAVTLTIRTTGSVPLPGVTVWLNTTNARGGSVVRPTTTNDAGAVVFNLHYSVAYYIFCHLAGYSFAEASMTPVAGTVAFTKDIATAVSVETTISEAFLARAISDIRLHTDEPDVTAKYSDTDLITKIEQAYPVVLGEINRNSRTPIVARLTLTLEASKYVYPLPPNLGMVWAIYALDATNQTKFFYHSKGIHNPAGRMIWVEGKTLHIQNPEALMGVNSEVVVEYTTVGTARLNNGICSVNTDGDEVTLPVTPSVGTLDTRDNAYAGCILRILDVTGTSPTGDYVQERTVTDYDRTTRIATLNSPLDPVPVAGDGGYIYYEIAPAINQGMDGVLALYAAYMIMNVENNPKRAGGILAMYRDQVRNLRLTTYYTVLEDASKLRADNYDNRRYRRAY